MNEIQDRLAECTKELKAFYDCRSHCTPRERELAPSSRFTVDGG